MPALCALGRLQMRHLDAPALATGPRGALGEFDEVGG